MDPPVLLDDVMQDEQATRPSKPRVGLLSQTLIPSPAILFVLPARLRSRHCNDVVLVGETHLQVKQVMPDLRLEDVAVESDFGAAIMAAKTINTQVEDTLPLHIVVLTLKSRNLVLLFHSGTSFVHFCHAMPSYVRPLDSFGRHLAVDPRWVRIIESQQDASSVV